MECKFPTNHVEMPEDLRLAMIAYDEVAVFFILLFRKFE